MEVKEVREVKEVIAITCARLSNKAFGYNFFNFSKLSNFPKRLQRHTFFPTHISAK